PIESFSLRVPFALVAAILSPMSADRCSEGLNAILEQKIITSVMRSKLPPRELGHPKFVPRRVLKFGVYKSASQHSPGRAQEQYIGYQANSRHAPQSSTGDAS